MYLVFSLTTHFSILRKLSFESRKLYNLSVGTEIGQCLKKYNREMEVFFSSRIISAP